MNKNQELVGDANATIRARAVVIHAAARRVEEAVGVRGDGEGLERLKGEARDVLHGRLVQYVREGVELLRAHVAVELAPEQELKLERVHLLAGDAADAGVVLVVKVDIVAVLGGEEHTRNEDTVNGGGVNEQVPLAALQAVQVHKGHDEALHGARGVVYDALHVLADRDVGNARGMEPRHLRGGVRLLLVNNVFQGHDERVNEHVDGGVGQGLHLHL
eukprot:CAMPEP_0119131444 /NCGR_PEP_ID=MMETSP1310-20130426/10386_1 /TAXON_ID=464262 /ORGANISM="Genus nov. species nov., Strain RCC2339" /LENGTH=216 /DNA_ID=CAMNT_0007122017 /DNA_START=135 /DNA_END=786 /DNA_ORIENTATION=+